MKKAWLRYFLGFSVLTILGGCGGGSVIIVQFQPIVHH